MVSLSDRMEDEQEAKVLGVLNGAARTVAIRPSRVPAYFELIVNTLTHCGPFATLVKAAYHWF